MEEFRENPADAGADRDIPPQQAAIERLLMSFGEQTYHDLSRFRFAEEREWYEQALFYQRRQWLSWNESSRRYEQVKQKKDKPRPMPVTNYFKKAINQNANQLQKPRMTAVARDEADATRRAAEYAERAVAAIDEESGFEVMRPILAKHVPLWGIGVTKDIIDTSQSAGIERVAELQLQKVGMVSCLDCGQASPTRQPAPTAGADGQQQTDPNAPTPALADMADSGAPDDAAEPGATCPQCGSANVRPYDDVTGEASAVHNFPKGKLLTEVPPIFEMYLPRDCRNPNLAKRVIQRYRKGLGQLREIYGQKADKIKAEVPWDTHQIYLEAIRALVSYNYMHEQTIEATTVTEMWWEWSETPRRVQKKLEEYWSDDPASLEKAIRQGLYEIYSSGTMLDWGINPWWDQTAGRSYTPYTFYLWELDPANVYPMGASTDLVPLQKRLNRLDSLVELAFMCNAAGKWLWPLPQSGKTPTGSPNEVIPYDVIGEGKVAPTFVQPSPIHESAYALRASIIQDFQQIGGALGVGSSAPAPQGAKAFRALAYLGAKAEEDVNTQRFLWELGHQLRYRKTLLMAQQCWDVPRMTRVAGYNGKFGMVSLQGEMLKGNYQVDFVPDSSRPQLPSEKAAAFAQLLQGGMIDVTDSATREYVLDVSNLDDVNLADHLQYLKAERDLEKVKHGQAPQESPFQKWDVFLKVFANFTLTEEFEALPPPNQQMVILYTQHLNQMTTMATQGAGPPSPGGPGSQQLGSAMAGKKHPAGPHAKPSHLNAALNKVPGQNTSPQAAQQAAAAQGAGIAHQLA